MTTHDEQMSSAREATAEPQPRGADPATPAREAETPAPAAAVQSTERAREPGPGAVQDDTLTDDNTLLFADEHRSGLHSRWDEVQAAFVDDPKECVQKADNLVAEVVDELTASFADTRSRLEAQWSRGEEASTEDLRVALKRYRDFFQRLLSV
ncbi:hypothetical protein ABQF34_19775 [Mycolicibacterium boenickei]